MMTDEKMFLSSCCRGKGISSAAISENMCLLWGLGLYFIIFVWKPVSGEEKKKKKTQKKISS